MSDHWEETQRLGKRRARLAAQLAEINGELQERIPVDHAAGIGTVTLARVAGVSDETIRRWCLPPERQESLNSRRRKAKSREKSRA